MEGYSALLAIREMQIKTTVRYCFTPSGMARMKKTVLARIWRFLKKLKIELPYDPAIPLLSIYPEKTVTQKIGRAHV